MRPSRHIPVIAAILVMLSSCSTTKFLGPGQSRLASNEIQVTNSKKFNTAEISPYIKQQANTYFIFGWNPFLNVYNWGDGSGKGIDKIWRKIGTAPVVFNPALVESSCNNLKKRLEYLGYFDSDVQSEVITRNKLTKVRYTVTLGKQYRIDEIRYNIPDQEDFSERFYADTSFHLVKVGDCLSENLLEDESVRAASKFRGAGYYDFSKNNYFFIADTISTPGRLILNYDIHSYNRNEGTVEEERPVVRYRFGNVSITHSADIKFRDKPLKNLNLIKPGDWYDENTVNTTYSRLSSIKAFSSVSMQLNPVDSAVIDCNINLGDTKQQGFKVDLEASTNSNTLIGISPQISWYHKNIFHGGERLTVGFTGNFQFKPGTDIRSNILGINASLSFPRFLGLPYDAMKGPYIPITEIKGSFNYQDRPEYKRNMAAGTFGYTWQIGKDMYFQVNPLQLTYVKLYNISEEFREILNKNPYMWSMYSDHIDAGIGAVLYHITDTDIVPKKPFHYERVSLDMSGNLISLFNRWLPYENGIYKLFNVPYTQYIKAEMQVGRTVRWGENNGQAIAMRFLAGAGHAFENSSALPYEKSFYCGGASSMRGWQAHALGPGFDKMDTFFSIPSQVGDMKLEADLEWRFRMFWKFEGAMFAEAGNVWELNSGLPDFAASIAGDWGLGLRLNLDFILVRLDAGFKVREPSRDPGYRWIGPKGWFSRDGYAIHFGVGYPF